MKLPIKIDPDRIKDSIIEVRFISNLPFEIYLGYIYQSLDDSYKYTNRPIGNNFLSPLGNQSSLFFNDFIKFEIKPNSIIFNCVDKYLTWGKFYPEIQKVLSQISLAKVVEFYNRVGIRYISEYPETEIKEITKFSFSFGMPNVSSENYSFRTQYSLKNSRIIINLSSKIPILNNTETKQTLSIIDIDIIKENFSIKDLKELFKIIEEVHSLEKETFFGLIDTEFLKSLNPEY